MSALPVTTVDSISWLNRPDTDDYLGPSGHEEPLMRMLLPLMARGQLFVDIGAHIGEWSIRMAQHGLDVIAFEANPETFKVLNTNIHMNYLESRIQTFKACLWDEKGVRLSLRDEKGYTSGGSTGVVQSFGTTVETVFSSTADSFLSGRRPNFIKIDVEGAEVEVLRGLSETLQKYHPHLFIEVHEHLRPNVRGDVEDILNHHGYRWGKNIPYGGGYHLLARREGLY